MPRIEKTWVNRKPSEFPPVMANRRPSDYEDDLHRGTIEFSPEWFNYSYHKVVIPAGTVIRKANFTQVEPKTDCITIDGEGTVTFIDCNLGNVLLKRNFVLEHCNTTQSDLVEEDDAEMGVVEKRQFICSHPDEYDENRVKPPRRVTSRNY